jgi:hypothetical protein
MVQRMSRGMGIWQLCLCVTVYTAVAAAGGNETEPAPLFEDVTGAAGLARIESARVAFADLNGDGLPDVLVGGTKLLLNENGRRFADCHSERILAPPGRPAPNVVQVGDVNNDGRLDLFLGRFIEPERDGYADDGLRSEVWLGDGRGGFALVPNSGVGEPPEATITACFVDYDRDGNLDLFVGNSYVVYGRGYEACPDRLFRGRGDGTFEDVTAAAGLLGVSAIGQADSRRPTYGVTHTDWNNDGWQDLLVCSYGRQWNRLWRNNGDRTFTDVAAETGFDGDAERCGTYPPELERTPEPPFRANGNTFDCAVADFNNDGNMDCFLAEIAHWWAGPSSDRSMLLVNLGPAQDYRFRRAPEMIERPHASERWNEGDMHAGWLDVDNDGLLDLLIASSDYPDKQILRLYRQRPDGQFDDWTDRLGFRWRNASQISLADFDRDGATDILVATNDRRLTEEQRSTHSLSIGLFRNVAAARAGNRFLSIRLEGQAVGARVAVVTGEQRQIREVYGGLGHAGHRDDAECRFGVGRAESADLVEVRWPDAAGTVQSFKNVATSRFYRLSRGGELRQVDR